MKTPNQRRPMQGKQPTFAKPKFQSPTDLHKPKHNNPPPKPRRRPRVSDELIYDTILSMCREAGLEGSVRPEDIARALVNSQWQTLLHRIRQTAAKQAHGGDIVILRKGEIADPDDFKGLVKLQITPQGMVVPEAAEGEQPITSNE